LDSPAVRFNSRAEVIRNEVWIACVTVDTREKTPQPFWGFSAMFFRECDLSACFVWKPFSPINAVISEVIDSIKNGVERDLLPAHLLLSSPLSYDEDDDKSAQWLVT
jgi:hypothetical protein